MATMMAPLGTPEALSQSLTANQPQLVAQREVVRCAHCKLNQYRRDVPTCLRCKKSIEVEKPVLVSAPIAVFPAPAAAEKGLQVATAVRDLRHVRNLSQRQLAGRMGVPRTYISKIENGKAMPTLSSLDRLARALDVDISALLRDATSRHSNEAAMLMTDPFLAELAFHAVKLDATQRSIFLNHVRELASGRRKMA